jgi:hypothetical protein
MESNQTLPTPSRNRMGRISKIIFAVILLVLGYYPKLFSGCLKYALLLMCRDYGVPWRPIPIAKGCGKLSDRG